jgi:6,7-dimethyl-8-ribityllumazine synthase
MASVKTINGNLDGSDCRIAIVASRFNEFFVKRLMDGCLSTLKAAGLEAGAITVVWVPGAFEIPLVAKALALAGKTDAVIALGAVIRGETAHFEYVAGECARGVAAVGVETGIPVIFGVLTVDDSRHALERSGEDENNKGSDAARAALETISVLRQIRA